MARILLIDDEPSFSEALREQVQKLGHEVRWLDLAEDGLRLLAEEAYDLVLLDNLMPRMSGLEFLKVLKERGLRVPVILMTSAPNDHTVIQATKMGAFAYVVKPVNFDDILPELEPELRKALEIGRRPPPVPLPRPGGQASKDAPIVGRSKPMIEVFQRIALASEVDDTVLILGETGTGKDLVARAIHTNSSRKDNPYVVIDCTTLTDNLAVADLFGYEKNWYTGAEKMRKGRFEYAEGGTVFLDEIGDMPLNLQAMLLRVLENREVLRGGNNEPIPVNVRVLAATHRDLPARVREGLFRQDLYFRLQGRKILLPSLRERQEDILYLAQHFLSRITGDSSSAPTLHPGALEALRRHAWPGNIRELRDVICRAVGSCRGAQLMAEDLDLGEPPAASSATAKGADSLDDAIQGLRQAIAWAWQNQQADKPWPMLQKLLERELLQFALRQPHKSEDQLADLIGIVKNTLRKWKKDHGVKKADESNP